MNRLLKSSDFEYHKRNLKDYTKVDFLGLSDSAKAKIKKVVAMNSFIAAVGMITIGSLSFLLCDSKSGAGIFAFLGLIYLITHGLILGQIVFRTRRKEYERCGNCGGICEQDDDGYKLGGNLYFCDNCMAYHVIYDKWNNQGSFGTEI